MLLAFVLSYYIVILLVLQMPVLLELKDVTLKQVLGSTLALLWFATIKPHKMTYMFINHYAKLKAELMRSISTRFK